VDLPRLRGELSFLKLGGGALIPIARPVIGEEEKQAVLRVLDSGRLAQGPVVREFEEEFARWLSVREAIAVSSGTAALMLALQAHGIGPRDEVITTPFSFIATGNAILYVGARPVFADVRADDFNIDPADVKTKITPRTRAILPVHLYGHPARMAEIMSIAESHGLLVIEDAAQAHGAELDGRKAGAFATGCFSFYPTKNMTTGEGGMVTTDDGRIADLLRKLRHQGQTDLYNHEILAYNWRMTEVAAAMGLAQLGRLEEMNQRRRNNAGYLSQRLRGVITPEERPGCHHVYHQYTVRVTKRRDALLDHLRERGIGAQLYYPKPIHQQPVYRRLGYKDDLPVAQQLSAEVLSLPVHPSLTQDELDRIVESVNEFIRGDE
jgi:perosamine synthetase